MAFSFGSGTGTGAESSRGNAVPAVAGTVCWTAGLPAVAPVNTDANTTARPSACKARVRRIKLSAHGQDQPGTEPEKRAANKMIALAAGDRSKQHSPPNPMQADFPVRLGIPSIVAS